MGSSPTTNHLQAFQSSGRKEYLLAYVRAEGRTPDQHAAAMDALQPALEPLFYGLRPAMRALDREGLREHAAAAIEILVWLAESPKADLKTAAMELMGSLGWDAFIPWLERALASPTSWERIAAVDSLAQMPGRRAAELVRRTADDPDLAVRTAAERALDTRRQDDR